MRPLMLVIVLVAACAPPGPAASIVDAGSRADEPSDAGVPSDANPGEALDEGIVHEVALEIQPASWQALLDAPREYARASLVYDGHVLPDVGVRLKGNRSFRPLDGGGKPAFKVKLDEFEPAQELHGLTRITLNNATQDPTAAHERLFYRLARASGVPAPRAASVHLAVNGEDYGLYVHVEAEDKRFLARWFTSDEGNLYEGSFVDLDVGSVGGFELETHEATGDRSDLEALAAALDQVAELGFHAALEAHLDIPAFLRFAAAEGVGAHEDGYAFGNGEIPPNNYRLYADPSTGRFFLLPWGADVSMRSQTSIFGIRGRLLFACTADAACRAEFVAAVEAMLAAYPGLALPEAVAAMRTALGPFQATDPRAEHDAATIAAAWDESAAFVEARPAEVRSRLDLEDP